MINFLYNQYKKHFLLGELAISFLIVIILIFCIQNIWINDEIESWINLNGNNLYSLIATTAGTLFGFVITGVSILFVFPDTSNLKKLRNSPLYKYVYKIYISTIKYLGLTLIISVVAIFCHNYIVIFFYVVLWTIIITFFRIWRCLWVLTNMIDIMILDKNKK